MKQNLSNVLTSAARSLSAAAVCVLVTGSPVLAADGAPSMQGKTITLYVGVGAGGGYDAYGRLLARFMSKHIPGNPTIIVSNMPGGGGRVLSNYMAKVAPKDGTAMAIVQHTTVYDAVFGEPGVHYDPRTANWLGSMAKTTFVALTWHTTGVRTLDDLKTKEVSVGATGPGANSYQYPALMNAMFGTKFKIITGYKTSNEIYHAVEQREIDGTGGLAWDVFRNAHPDWVRDKKIDVLVQYALKPHRELSGVPLVLSLARSEDEKQILRFVFSSLDLSEPFLVPEGTPKAQVDMLRKAFSATVADPELLRQAETQRLDIEPIDGEAVQQIVGDIFNVDSAIKDKAKKMLGL